ncbi:MAG: GntR family transcriptional regulator [Leucobacter sp.]
MAHPEQVRPRGGDAGSRVAERLREDIVQGRLSPGTRIRQEDVAARFGASRVPVREALSLLAHEGLVTTVANSGSWVSVLTLAECEEIYRMRERLEPLLLSYSAPHLTDADFQLLDDLSTRIGEASRADRIDEFLRLDREFHLASYARAQTLQLGDLISKLWNTTAPYRRAYVATWSPGLRRIADDEHNIMVSALRDGDLSDAKHVLRGHIRRTRRQLSKHPEIFET